MKKIHSLRTIATSVVASMLMILTNATALAATTPTFAATTGNNGYMLISVTGDASSAVKLTYYPFAATTPTTIDLGTTDANGNFFTSISASVYNIVNGTSAYATVRGVQSATLTWPSFAGTTNTNTSLSLNQYTASLSVGQSIVIYSANAALYSATSNAAAASATINNGQATITGVAAGTAIVNMCSTTGNCNGVTVTVASRESPLNLNQSYLTLSAGQGAVVISSNSSITRASSNSSAAVPYANNGQVTIIGQSYGTATISVCNAASLCDSIFVTVQNPTGNSVVLSQNVVSVGVGQSVIVYDLNGKISTASGNAPNASIGLNSSSGSNQVTITGITSGSETVTICDSARNCNAVYVTVQGAPTTNNLSLNQKTVLLSVGQSTAVSASSSTIVTVTSNTSDVSTTVRFGQVTIIGQKVGSATVTACNANNLCDLVYVTVQAAQNNNLSLSQTTATLTVGKSLNVSSPNSIISSASSNSTAASAVITNGQITIKGVSAGSSIVTACNTSSSCGTVNVTVVNPVVTIPAVVVVTTTVSTPTPDVPAAPVAKTLVYTRLLTLGSVGADVRALQNRLLKEGLFKGPATGTFGPLTQKAVKRFQAKHNILTVGYTGPATRAALNAE